MNALTHEEAAALLHEAASHLDTQQHATLAAHLGECDQCRAYADQLNVLQPMLTRALRTRRYASLHLPEPTLRSIQRYQRRLHMRKQLFSIVAVLAVGLIVLAAISINRYPGSISAGRPLSPTATPTATPTLIPTVEPSVEGSARFKLPWTVGVTHCIMQNHLTRGNGLGLDFDLKFETILAPQDGTVTYAGWNSEGGGNTIIISHTGGVTSTYMHLSLIAVKQGVQVRQGQPIGAAGDTGDTPGPLLHFHVEENGRGSEPVFAEAGHALKEGDCVTSRNVPPSASDRFEPNDNFDQATPIDLNVKYDQLNFAMLTPSAGGWDNDFFKVRIKPGMLITCRTLDLSPGTDTNLILYDESRNGIAGNDDVDRAKGDLSSSVTYNASYEGWLYILVGEGFSRSPAEAQQATYSLECSINK